MIDIEYEGPAKSFVTEAILTKILKHMFTEE